MSCDGTMHSMAKRPLCPPLQIICDEVSSQCKLEHERRENKLRIAQIVFGKREVSAHTLEYQREEDAARKQKVTQRRQYRELIDIDESHEGVLFAHCIFAATRSPRDTHNRGTQSTPPKKDHDAYGLRNNESGIQGIQRETRRRRCIIQFKGHSRFANHTDPCCPRT